MELLFLGTSSGTPTTTRNVSGLALRAPQSGHWSLVDCGEGTQHQILHTSLSLHSLRAIFITHIHGDHCYGLPGLLASAGMLNRTEPLYLAGPRPVMDFVRCVMRTTELWLSYAIEFIAVEELAGADVLPGLAVRATALSHRVPSFAYTFTETAVENKIDAQKLAALDVPAGPLWGQIQQGRDIVADGRILHAADYLLPSRRPRRIIVGGDNDRPELLVHEARAADVLVHEATYTEDILRKLGPAPQHSCAGQVARFARDAGIPNLVLTHFSPRYQQQDGGRSLREIEDEARAGYKGRLFLANDFERYLLDRQGILARVAAT